MTFNPSTSKEDANMAINPVRSTSNYADSESDEGANVLIFQDAKSADLAYEILCVFGDLQKLGPILKGISKHAFVVCGPEMEEMEHTTVVIDAGRNIAPPVDLEMADAAAWESWDEMGFGDSEASENPEDYAVPV
jgi:hypothetical protein